jgi:hypothetical protein
LEPLEDAEDADDEGEAVEDELPDVLGAMDAGFAPVLLVLTVLKPSSRTSPAMVLATARTTRRTVTPDPQNS